MNGIKVLVLALTLSVLPSGVMTAVAQNANRGADATTARTTDRDDDGFDWGWLGLLGLLGLTGLLKRDRRDVVVDRRT